MDISLLDFGNARLSGGLNNGQLQLGAMASIWEPTITFKVFGVNISLGGNIGSIGAEIDIGTNSFKLSGALAIGIGIEIDWE